MEDAIGDGTRPRFEFRRLGEADLPLVAAWLARPHVRRWWGAEQSVDALLMKRGTVTCP